MSIKYIVLLFHADPDVKERLSAQTNDEFLDQIEADV